MIEKTIEELKNAENKAEEKIMQARQESSGKLKELTDALDRDWSDITSGLSGIKAEVLKKYEKEALEKINNIKEKSRTDISALEKALSNKDNIIAITIKNLLKEK